MKVQEIGTPISQISQIPRSNGDTAVGEMATSTVNAILATQKNSFQVLCLFVLTRQRWDHTESHLLLPSVSPYCVASCNLRNRVQIPWTLCRDAADAAMETFTATQ